MAGNWGAIARAAGERWQQAQGTTWAAALSFYSLFSLAPLLVLGVVAAGVFFGRSQAAERLETTVQSLAGPEAARLVPEVLAQMHMGRGVFAVVGLAMLLFGASLVFGELKHALNAIDGVSEPQEGLIWRRVADRVAGIIGVVVMAGVFVAWVAFDAVVRALGAQALGLPGGTLVLSTLGLFALVALGAGLLFRQVPDARVPWRAVWPGAIATGALLAIAKFAFSLYLGFTRLAVVYGAAGSLAALLIWVFVSWLGLLAGAAIARAWAELNGLPITPASTADGVRQAVPGLARGEARAEEAARRLWPRNRPRTPR